MKLKRTHYPEAVRLANDSRYDLAAAVMSADDEHCERVAAALRAGIVWINCSQPTFVEAPWGGTKQRGSGESSAAGGSKAISKPNKTTGTTRTSRGDGTCPPLTAVADLAKRNKAATPAQFADFGLSVAECGTLAGLLRQPVGPAPRSARATERNPCHSGGGAARPGVRP